MRAYPALPWISDPVTSLKFNLENMCRPFVAFVAHRAVAAMLNKSSIPSELADRSRPPIQELSRVFESTEYKSIGEMISYPLAYERRGRMLLRAEAGLLLDIRA